MRVTTWLLRECLGSDAIALLAESYLMGEGDLPMHLWSKKSVSRGYTREKSWNDIGLGGHVELIMHRIKKDKRETNADWRFKTIDLVSGVCAGGDIAIIRMIAAIVDKQYFEGGLGIFMTAIYADGAIEKNDDSDVPELLVSLGADAKNSKLMWHAAKNRDVDMCRFLISKGNDARDYVFEYAGIYGDFDLADLVSPPRSIEEYNLMVTMACKYNRLNFVKIVIPREIHDSNPLLARNIATRAIPFAVANDCVEITKHLLTLGADANIGFSEMCASGKRGSFEVLVNAGATSCKCGLAIDTHEPVYSKKRKADGDAK